LAFGASTCVPAARLWEESGVPARNNIVALYEPALCRAVG